MNKSYRFNNRPVIISAITAALMMFIFGVVYRTLTTRLTTPTGFSSISADSLDKLPLQIGQWTGQEEPLDEAIIEATDTDAHTSRRYWRYNASEQIWLYIAAGKRVRDLMPHRPEVCYTGAGWTRINSNSMKLILYDAKELPCSIFQFSKGLLNTKNVIILDYYIVDGQFCRDVSLLRSKIWRSYGTVGYTAQVQIVAVITADQTADSAVQMVSDFACESAPLIFRVLEGVADNENPDTNKLRAEDYLGSADND